MLSYRLEQNKNYLKQLYKNWIISYIVWSYYQIKCSQIIKYYWLEGLDPNNFQKILMPGKTKYLNCWAFVFSLLFNGHNQSSLFLKFFYVKSISQVLWGIYLLFTKLFCTATLSSLQLGNCCRVIIKANVEFRIICCLTSLKVRGGN